MARGAVEAEEQKAEADAWAAWTRRFTYVGQPLSANGSPGEYLLWAAKEGLLGCCRCGRYLEAYAFARAQRPKPGKSRTCIQCMEEANPINQQQHQRLFVCQLCGEAKDRSEYRRKFVWEAPECRRCLDQRWEQEHVAFLESRQDARDARAQERLAREMREFRELYAGLLERHRRRVDLLEQPLLWDERLRWALQLQRRIAEAELHQGWRTEAPSRHHARGEERKEAACQFKDLEDRGDGLVYETAASLFRDFAVGERRQVVSLSQVVLLQPVLRGHSFGFEGAVAVSFRPLHGWPLPSPDFRPEPRPWTAAFGDGDWRLLDDSAMVQLKVEASMVPDPEPQLELKLFALPFWQAVEEHSRQDPDATGGSHGKTFLKAATWMSGASRGANRTEVMCWLADLLGFYPAEEDHPAYPFYRVWREMHDPVHVPSPSFAVTYGMGAEFKADCHWQGKREANVAEALLGALGAELRHRPLVRAAVGLCLLAWLSPPRQLPSNWKMAERVVDMLEQDGYAASDRAFHKACFRFDAFGAKMDELLGSSF